MLKSAFVAVISVVVCSAQAPSTAQQKGSISGAVASAAGEPLKSATVRLQGAPQGVSAGGAASPPPAYATSSDAQGNFVFDDLEPGRYTLFAERAGYLRANYATTSGGFAAPIDLIAAQTLTGIAIKMTPQALISGKVTDEDGEPYPGVRVDLARWAYAGGQRRLQPYATVSSNAEGVFSFGGLAAGPYYITATPQQAGIFDAIQKGPQEVYVTTYYPGVTDPSSAIAIQVSAGAVVRNSEIRLRKARAYRVRGKFAGPVPPNTNLRLSQKDSQLGTLASTIVRDGAFDFERVVPGIYILEARSPGAGGAREIVAVGNADVDDLALRVGPGAEITGKISTEGATPPPPGTPGMNARPFIQLTALEGGGGASSGQIAEDGTFSIVNVMPGAYRVLVQPVPQGSYVKSIRFGSQDLLKSALDLTGGSGGMLNVVLSPNAGDVSGIVHNPDGTPLASVQVTLWTPGVPAEGATDFTRTSVTDANGQFKFANLPPGEYRIAAWEQIDPGLGVVPDFRIKFESKAAAVKLEENAHENTEAPLIGRDAIEAEAAKLQ
jgi:protocatechuate 3,4-dioxygenase beta subunit